LSPIAQKILFEPLPDHDRGCHHFWNIVEASATTHAQLSSLSGKDLSLRSWNSRATSWAIFRPLPEGYHLDVKTIVAAENDEKGKRSGTADAGTIEGGEEKQGFDTVEDEGLQHLECLSKLQELKLEFCTGEILPGHTSNLKTLLENLPQLHILRVSFGEIYVADRNCVAWVPEVIHPNITWTHLRNLSLQTMHTSSNDLRSLMRRHSGTLRSLHLTDMAFSRPVRGFELESSWISFIHFLYDELSLLQVRFYNNFSNSYDEAWFTCEWDKQPRRYGERLKRYKNECLRYQIERYVTHEGPSPFTAKLETKQALALKVKNTNKYWDKIDSKAADDAFGSEDDENDENGNYSLYDANGHSCRLQWLYDKDNSWIFKYSILV
jgi:hypothetical protein